MIKFKNDCVGCPTYCIECGRKHAPHYYCDVCEEEFDSEELYDVDGTMMCDECLLASFPKVKA